jgi:hypothetical protein
MTDYPEGTFGEAVKHGAGGGFLVGAMLTADGNPFVGIPLAMGVGAVANATRYVVKTVRASNQDVKRMRAQDEAREARKNRNLNGHQFKDIK